MDGIDLYGNHLELRNEIGRVFVHEKWPETTQL